jgi:signal transduction histidine kinase
MKLRTFILIVSVAIMTLVGAVLTLQTRRILTYGFERLNENYRDDMVNVVTASVAAKRSALVNYGQLLGLNFDLAGIYVVSNETHDRGMVAHSLDRIQRLSGIDIVDIIPPRGGAGQLRGFSIDPKALRDLVDRRGGVGVMTLEGSPALIGVSSLRLYNEIVGYLVLGYRLNETIAREIGEQARVRVAFTLGAGGGALPIENLASLDGGPVGLKVDLKEAVFQGLRTTIARNLVLFGAVLLVLLVVLIYLLLEVGFVRPFRRQVIAIETASRELQLGRLPTLSLSGHRVKEVNALAQSFNAFSQNLFRYDAQTREQARQVAATKQAAALTEMAQEVAHNIRSPLSALDMLVVASESMPENTRVLVRGAIKRIQDTASELLYRTRQNAQAVELHKVASVGVPIAAVLEEMRAEKQSQFAHRPGLRLELRFAESPFQYFVVSSNPSALRAIISNLIDNAIEATTAPLRIDIVVSTHGREIVAAFRDDGPGIAPDQLVKLGFKGVSFKETGTGLGLYHAAKTLRADGGQLEIESESGRGTVVTLRLVRAEIPNHFVAPETLVLRPRVFHSLAEWDAAAIPSSSSDGVLCVADYDDPEVQSAAQVRGLRLLPKSLLSYLPS